MSTLQEHNNVVNCLYSGSCTLWATVMQHDTGSSDQITILIPRFYDW